jgi:hypothetical protein
LLAKFEELLDLIDGLRLNHGFWYQPVKAGIGSKGDAVYLRIRIRRGSIEGWSSSFIRFGVSSDATTGSGLTTDACDMEARS